MVLHILQRAEKVLDRIIFSINHLVRRVASPHLIISLIPRITIGFIGTVVWILSLGKVPPQFNQILEVPGLENGKARWFAKAHVRERKDPVLLMLHGGGYALKPFVFHGFVLQRIYDKAYNGRLSVAWLDYSLSDEGRLPLQLQEALAIYKEIAKTSDNISIVGDSCGGHLTLILLREIHKLGLPKPKSLILISPWLQLLPDQVTPNETFKKYEHVDVLGQDILTYFGTNAIPLDPELASQVSDLTAFKDWPEILPPAKNIFISYGEHECLRHEIETFIKQNRLKESGARIFTEPQGVHDSPVMVGCGPLRLNPNQVLEEAADWFREHS